MVNEMFGKLKNINWVRFRDYMHLFLSHHPFCEHYDCHTFNVWKLRFCKGCTFAYPGIAIGLIYAFNFPLDLMFITYFVGLNVIYFFYITLFSVHELVKLISRLLAGVSAGFIVHLIIVKPWWPDKIIALVVFYSLASIVQYYRIQSLKRVCTTNCGADADLDTCGLLLPIRDTPSSEVSEVSEVSEM